MTEENSIKFISYAKPNLPAGHYKIEVTQDIKVQYDNKSDETRKYTQNMDLIVQFPRFSIAEKEIYEVYPPENGSGYFVNCLPYISFYKQTLPWIRSINDNIPWVALFVFEDEDQYKLTHGQVKDFFLHSKDVAMMSSSIQVENGENEEDVCDFIDVDKNLFMMISPTCDELSYLAHIKVMDFINKSTNSNIPNQHISTLISNQYITKKSRHICLISLEGMENFLKDLSLLIPFQYVRLPVLKQWNIYNNKEGIQFKERISQLDVDSIGLKHKDCIIQKGFVPLEHIDRMNNRLISWYHGPLISAHLSLKQHPHADDYDQYLSFDPDKAMFDVSYSTAYQLGSILAFLNKNIVSELSQLRLHIQQEKHKEHQDNILWKHRQKKEEDILIEIISSLGDAYYE